MPDVLDWTRVNPAEQAVRAAEHLRQGDLVIAPTDAVYAVLAFGLHAEAVARLAKLTGACPTLTLPDGPFELRDWLRHLDGLGWRLARHGWPGPLALQSRAGVDIGLTRRLPQAVRAVLMPDGWLTTRCPGHAAVGALARSLPGPIVAVELPGARCVDDIPAHVREAASLILDDGPADLGQTSTVVRVEGRCWTIVREGVLTRGMVHELAVCQVLFVCTGNTCRSPLAMSLCRQLLALRLGCKADELRQHGYQVQSAGLAAMPGEVASPDAVMVADEMGSRLEEHSSQPLSSDLLTRTDCLFTMTRSHLRLLQGLNLPLGPVPRMLASTGCDVADPIGCTIEVYRQCARQILEYLEERMPQILES